MRRSIPYFRKNFFSAHSSDVVFYQHSCGSKRKEEAAETPLCRVIYREAITLQLTAWAEPADCGSRIFGIGDSEKYLDRHPTGHWKDPARKSGRRCMKRAARV